LSATAPTPPTPQAAKPAPRPRKPLPSPLNVITGVLGLFLVILTLLALQVRSGKDPSLAQSTTTGTSSAGLGSAATTRQVVTKTS
jgi:hypothetical protein